MNTKTEKQYLYTFRTECEGDIKQVPELLKRMRVKLQNEDLVNDALCDFWKMGIFTFYSSASNIAPLRQQMRRIIDSFRVFDDMHRCYQTLKKGTQCNDNWFEIDYKNEFPNWLKKQKKPKVYKDIKSITMANDKDLYSIEFYPMVMFKDCLDIDGTIDRDCLSFTKDYVIEIHSDLIISGNGKFSGKKLWQVSQHVEKQIRATLKKEILI